MRAAPMLSSSCSASASTPLAGGRSQGPRRRARDAKRLADLHAKQSREAVSVNVAASFAGRMQQARGYGGPHKEGRAPRDLRRLPMGAGYVLTVCRMHIILSDLRCSIDLRSFMIGLGAG